MIEVKIQGHVHKDTMCLYHSGQDRVDSADFADCLVSVHVQDEIQGYRDHQECGQNNVTNKRGVYCIHDTYATSSLS